MQKVNILIIEDDMILAESLKDTLTEYGYNVSGIAREASRAIELALETKPDLIISDIHLDGERSGIEAIEEIKKDLDTVVIYLTIEKSESAFQQANQTSPDQFLVKPYSDRGVLFAVGKALERKSVGNKNDNLAESYFYVKKGLSPKNNYYQRIKIDQLLYIEADSDCAKIHLIDGTNYSVSMTLKWLSEHLQNTFMVRVHKSHLVNIKRVTKIYKDDKMLELEWGVKLPYSREKTDKIPQWFSILKTKNR